VGGNVAVVNTQLYGDQYSPRICRAGSTYLANWTSLGQDGSREGVYGRYLNDDGSVSGAEFRVNSTTAGAQKQQALGSDGAGRFMAAWTSFGGSAVSGFDLFAQKYIDPTATIIGTNNTALDTDPNNNTNSVDRNPIEPSVVLLPGATTPTPLGLATSETFSDVKGTYNGIVYDPNDVTSGNSGYLTITTTATTSFSGKLQMGGKSYSFSAKFDATGSNTTKVGAWTMTVVLDLHGGDRITGQITDGNWIALLQLNRAVFSKTKPTTLFGNYTLVVRPDDGSTGNGIGTLSVDVAGNVNCKLTLPDGTTFSEKTTLSKDGAWPLYAAPYKTGGLVIGWMQFQSAAPGDGFAGPCIWTKSAGKAAPYAGGLTNEFTVTGSLYKTPPLAYQTFGGATVVFSGAGLTLPITNSVMWGANNKIVNQSGKSMKLSLTASSGLFKGTVLINGKNVPFQGVLVEKNNEGLGFFPGNNESGGVSFAPNH
jgi:hypothetical protein